MTAPDPTEATTTGVERDPYHIVRGAVESYIHAKGIDVLGEDIAGIAAAVVRAARDAIDAANYSRTAESVRAEAADAALARAAESVAQRRRSVGSLPSPLSEYGKGRLLALEQVEQDIRALRTAEPAQADRRQPAPGFAGVACDHDYAPCPFGCEPPAEPESRDEDVRHDTSQRIPGRRFRECEVGDDGRCQVPDHWWRSGPPKANPDALDSGGESRG